MTAQRSRLVAGFMTGTSIDGLDASLVEIHGDGLMMSVRLMAVDSVPLGDLADFLRDLTAGKPVAASSISHAAHRLGELHLTLARKLAGGEKLDLAAVHGQTIYHRPPLSWQLMAPDVLAYGLPVPVVFDLRVADLARGGRGAPITPLSDLIMFDSPHETRAVVNLGGFCNVTLLPDGDPAARELNLHLVRGFDVCACNQLLDALARKLLKSPFDLNGAVAAGGVAVPDLTNWLVDRLDAQRRAGRSLGSTDEPTGWCDELHLERYRAPDALRSACAALATVIADTARERDRVILAGGGVKNQALKDELGQRLGLNMALSDSLGIPAQYRESAAIAVLGALCQDRIPITLPLVTGADRPPIAGSWILP